jgi:hypothetical protein
MCKFTKKFHHLFFALTVRASALRHIIKLTIPFKSGVAFKSDISE